MLPSNYKLSLLILTIFLVDLVHSSTTVPSKCIEKYTKVEKVALEKFRKAVTPFIYLDYQKEDAYLINWLRHKELNIGTAVEAFENSMRWRKENNVDNILKDKDAIKFQKKYPTTFGKAFDKEGHPVCEMTFAKWDIRRGLLAGFRDSIWKSFVYSFEFVASLARKAGKHKFVVLINMQGYNLRQHACFACFPLYLDVAMTFENNYPDSVHRVVMINTPILFDSLSQLIRPLLSQTTRNASYIFGTNKNDWQPFLLDMIEKDQLPPQFGGTRPN